MLERVGERGDAERCLLIKFSDRVLKKKVKDFCLKVWSFKISSIPLRPETLKRIGSKSEDL